MTVVLHRASGPSGFHFTVSFAPSRSVISFSTCSCFHVSWGHFTSRYYITISLSTNNWCRTLCTVMKRSFVHVFQPYSDRQDISNTSLMFQCLHILMSIFLEMSLCSAYNGRWLEELQRSVMALTLVSVTVNFLKFVLVLANRELTSNEDAFDWRPWSPWRLTSMTQWYQNI
jgi:hypothetical protein